LALRKWGRGIAISSTIPAAVAATSSVTRLIVLRVILESLVILLFVPLMHYIRELALIVWRDHRRTVGLNDIMFLTIW
jgi:hypothetical protein